MRIEAKQDQVCPWHDSSAVVEQIPTATPVERERFAPERQKRNSAEGFLQVREKFPVRLQFDPKAVP